MEALLRCTHPVMGAISPAEFIALIERTHAIHEVSSWVLNSALAQVARWQASGLYLTAAVNVSGRNLEQPGFVESVRRVCEAHRVDARWLHIECTENVALTSERIAQTLREIDALGVQISLDDFGIGYSNIACLNRLPIGLIKLDQSLVKPITQDFRAWTLAQSLVTFGHSLGYRVLGEGVEDKATYDLLVEAGCDAVQGYFLSRPLEAEAIMEFMRTNQSARVRATK